MDHLLIETPEQIPLEFPVAGIGSRFLALAFDTLLQVLLGVALVSLALIVGLRGFHTRAPRLWVAAVVVLMIFVLHFGYFAIFEAIWNGQTPGKRITHLRVIQDSGRAITGFEAIARNLLRIVDGMPMFYGIAIISALISAKSKRLGDYVAGTVVVHEKPAVIEGEIRWDAPASAAGARYDVSRLSPAEFQLIEAFLLRRSQLSPNVRADTARKIVLRLKDPLALTPEDLQAPETLLETLATAYRARARYR